MPLILRNTKGSPLTYSELDANLTYLLTNMSGSNVSILGSTVGINSGNWKINSSGEFQGKNIYVSGDYTSIGDYSNGNSGTTFIVDDNSSIFKFSNNGRVNPNVVASINATNGAVVFDSGNITSDGSGRLTTKGLTVTGSLNVSGSGLVITGSLRVNDFISASGQLNVGSLSSYVPNNILGTTYIGFNAFSTAGTILTVGIPTNSPFFTFGYNTSINSGGIMQVTGSLLVTGSATINNILTLAVQSSTPASGFTTGSVIVSGSGANVHMYFHNGTTWKQLDN